MLRSVKSSAIASVPVKHTPNPTQPNSQLDYSPLMKLGFQTLKSFFLFIAGFCIAYTFSASLNATSLIVQLHELASVGFVPMVAFTFSVMAIVAVLESFR